MLLRLLIAAIAPSLATPQPIVQNLWVANRSGALHAQFRVLLFPASPVQTARHTSGPVVIERALLVAPNAVDEFLFTFEQGGRMLRADADAFDLDVDPALMQRYVDRLNAELTPGGPHDVRVERTIVTGAVRYELCLTDADGLDNWFEYEIGEAGLNCLRWRAERFAEPRSVVPWMLGGMCAGPLILGAGVVGVIFWRRRASP